MPTSRQTKRVFDASALENCHAVVTGGASGIGKAVAGGLLSAGASVTIADLEGDAIETALRELADKKAEGRILDVADRAGVAEFAGGLQQTDILVNCAGILIPHAADDIDAFNRMLAVNLTGTLMVSTALHPLLAKRGGSIVMIASGTVFTGYPLSPGYAASKGGIVTLTRTLAQLWVKDRIRVNAIAPGLIDTPMSRPQQSDAARLARVMSRTPMGRLGTPEEIADMVVFLSTPAASYITGTLLPVDGGFSGS